MQWMPKESPLSFMHVGSIHGVRLISGVKALLRHGADIDHRDSLGRTALMLAAMGPSVDEASRILLGLNPITDIQFALVTLLLERGADLAVADNEGRTVRDLTDINQLVRAELDKAQHSSDHVLK